MKKFKGLIIEIIILLLVLTGCGKAQDNSINDKLNAELEYLEDLIFKITNKYAKDEYTEDEKINWDYIKGDIFNINDAWNSAILDLSKVDIDDNEILKFSSSLNNLLISVSNQNEGMMISNLNDMYSQIIVFEDSYSNDKIKIERQKIKSQVLSTYNFLVQNQFEQSRIKIEETINNYKELMNNDEYKEANKYDLNKVYILLLEFRTAIQTQNYDLTRLKYILAVEEL